VQSEAQFKDAIYDTWAEHIGVSPDAIRHFGYHIQTLDDLNDTNQIQLFKIGSFTYIRCGANLHDTLDNALQAIQQTSPSHIISGEDLAEHLVNKNIDYDHIEQVFYLYPPDFTSVQPNQYHIRQLSEADTNAFEIFKNACTQEEYEDSWVNVTDELSYGAFDGDLLIGCASMYMLWGFADPGILVHPDYRGQGIGKQLISKICEWVIAENRIMNYRCTTDNHASAHLAQRLGFKKHFEIEDLRVVDGE